MKYTSVTQSHYNITPTQRDRKCQTFLGGVKRVMRTKYVHGLLTALIPLALFSLRLACTASPSPALLTDVFMLLSREGSSRDVMLPVTFSPNLGVRQLTAMLVVYVADWIFPGHLLFWSSYKYYMKNSLKRRGKGVSTCT